MLRKSWHMIAALAAALLWACGDDDRFLVEGVVDGLGTRNLVLAYESGGGLRVEPVTAIDGKFAVEGASREHTLAHLLTADGRLVARLLVRNGQSLKVVFDIDNPCNVQAKGSRLAEEWARFLRDNQETLRGDDHAAANRLVAGYVASHPDDMLSAVLMLTSYYAVDDEARADSVMALISPKARPDALVAGYRRMLARLNSAAYSEKVRSFSLYSAQGRSTGFYPGRASYSLLYFSGDADRREAAAATLRRLADSVAARRLQVLEVSMATDTATWHRNWRADTTAWPQLWAPGGPANPSFSALNLPRLPYWILCDSAGVQVYRGASLAAAVDSLRQRLHATNF